MNSEPKISVFKDHQGVIPLADISIFAFYENVVNGEYKSEILIIRTIEDKAERDAIKRELPGFTISGTFSYRDIKHLVKHSGRICIDLDPKLNPEITDWPGLRDALCTWKEIEFASLSASGRGVFVVIPIAWPEKHNSQFQALQADFKQAGLVIDPSPCSVNSMRFMSYDPDAKFKPDVIQYRKLYREKPPHYQKPIVKQCDKLPELIAQIERARIDITNDYSNWFQIGAALANTYGEMGRGYFHTLSQFHSEYNSSKTNRQFNACLRRSGNYTIATVFHLAKQYNIKIKD